MFSFPINYDEPLFRPPSEARSLIIQVTLGCSWNKCAFCEMYTSKQFRARKEADVFADIHAFKPYANQIRKIFLADGDAMVLSTNKLLRILTELKNTFPKLQRISAYASPRNLNDKSVQEMKELNNAGLSLIYVGIESGDNQVLEMVNKGEYFNSIVSGLNKSKQAGINSSVMIINGLGGKEFSEQHAINSAKILNETQPKYASTLVLSTYKGLDYYKSRLKESFTQLNLQELISEMKIFIENTNLQETIFRSDHASNYLVLKGVLGREKESFLNKIDFALRNPNIANLRSEDMRGF